MMNKEERIGMYTSDEIYEELANGFLQRSMVDAMYFKIKELQNKIDKAIEFLDKVREENGNEIGQVNYERLIEILGGKECN